MKTTVIIALLFLLATTGAFALELDCTDPADIPRCKTSRILVELGNLPVPRIEQTRAVLRLAPPRQLTERIDQDVADARTAVAADPTAAAAAGTTPLSASARAAVRREVMTETVATTPPQSSPARIHASRQNFNIPLSLAVNTIERSKDEQSLIIRFNPIQGPFAAGLTGTITKPKLFTRVEKDILPEANRATVAKALGEMLEETDDISLAVHLSPATPECTDNLLSRRACYGTDVRAYDDQLNKLLFALVPAMGTSAVTAKLEVPLRNFVHPIKDTLFKDLTLPQQNELFERLITLKNQDALDTSAENKQREKSHVANLAKLIENQPLWTLTLNAARRDVLVGANAQSADLEYQFGLVNLNSVYAKCKLDRTCLAEALKDPKTGSFKFGVSVKQTDAYHSPALPEGATSDENVTLPSFSIDRLRSYLANLQYGSDLHATISGDKRLHFDVFVTWEQKSGGAVTPSSASDERKHDTRFVAGSTLSIPLGEDIVLPITLNYANHPEFLEDTQKGLGVHFGLTYRLPFGKPK